jgi:hypothetical protein
MLTSLPPPRAAAPAGSQPHPAAGADVAAALVADCAPRAALLACAPFLGIDHQYDGWAHLLVGALVARQPAAPAAGAGAHT